MPQYSDMKAFTAPDGVETLRVDRASGMIADATCPSDSFTAAFLNGTAPQGTCSHMGTDIQTLGNQLSGSDDHRNVFQKILGIDKPKPPDQNQNTSPPPH
jgi:penicillin-binding protein 1B